MGHSLAQNYTFFVILSSVPAFTEHILHRRCWPRLLGMRNTGAHKALGVLALNPSFHSCLLQDIFVLQNTMSP